MKNLFFILTVSCFFILSCKKDNDTLAKQSVEVFNITLNTSNAIPTVLNRNETGIATLELFDDNTLEFSITINNLSSSDALTVAHVHLGNVVEAGGVAFGLVDATTISFAGNTVTGVLTLTETEISMLQGSDVYVNVHSTESPAGLVRGQIDHTIDYAYNVNMSTENQVPVIPGRMETGDAIFRIVGTTMYYKVSVNDLATTDAIVAGHIHEGSATENGGVLIDLGISDGNQLNIMKSVTLSSDELQKINNDALYVNVHSAEEQAGLLRGQIR